MKKLMLIPLVCGLILPAQAQLFSRESLGGAALGGLAGGIIGHNSGRKTAEGAAIGAGAGLFLGAIVGQSRRDHYYVSGPSYVSPVYSAPVVTYGYPPPRPNYAVTGAALGGMAGGIIGHNNGRKTAEGIAIGAGAGLLLGAVAEQDARRRELYYRQPTVVYAPAPVATTVVQAQPASAPAPQPAQQVTVLNNYYGSASSMSSANALFGR